MVAILIKLVNSSLESATFSSIMKHAIVTPTVQKPGIDPSSLSSYRPISNLPFVSKPLERVVAHQLTTYLNMNCLLPTHQSAYRRHHSTETALLAICNDALMAADRGMITLVVLLDLSAAFDTVEHITLLGVFQTRFGISGAALSWHNTYLSERSYRVLPTGGASSLTNTNDVRSASPCLLEGVFLSFIITPTGSRHSTHNQ